MGSYFKIEDLKSMLNKAEEESCELGKVIGPFINREFTDKENLELCHVGKFLLNLRDNASIVKKSESPDFVISYKNEIIGLEHESILSEDSKSKKYRSIKRLFREAATVFSDKYPRNNLIANIYLNDNNFSFKKTESDFLKNEIADYVYTCIKQNVVLKPDYISEVKIFKHSKVSFVYNPGAHYVESLDNDRLIKAIKRKENRVDKYIENTGTNRQWLLLAIGTVEPDSYEFNECSFNGRIDSKFEHIFLLEDYSGEIYIIK